MTDLPAVRATRLLAAVRRGSSSPLVVEADDGARWLVKLRGAAQGTGPLVAEVLVAELAEALGLRVPARARVVLDPGFAAATPGDELADLVHASVGDNLGLAYLDGARELELADLPAIDRALASRIVWLDGLVMNVDRTAANPNILRWRGDHWLVDHGAALPFQYAWRALSEETPRRPPPPGPPHVLAARATLVGALDEALTATLTREVLAAAAARVPQSFLSPHAEPARLRAAYVAFLWKRLRPPRPFVPATDAV